MRPRRMRPRSGRRPRVAAFGAGVLCFAPHPAGAGCTMTGRGSRAAPLRQRVTWRRRPRRPARPPQKNGLRDPCAPPPMARESPGAPRAPATCLPGPPPSTMAQPRPRGMGGQPSTSPLAVVSGTWLRVAVWLSAGGSSGRGIATGETRRSRRQVVLLPRRLTSPGVRLRRMLPRRSRAYLSPPARREGSSWATPTTTFARWILFNGRDWKAAAADLAEDCELIDHARNFTAKGREQCLEAEKGWVAAFSDARVTDARVIDGGDATVLLFTGTGTNDGPSGPLPATGRTVNLSFCEVRYWDSDWPDDARRVVLRPGRHARPARPHAAAGRLEPASAG